jgi:hypothetical protein
VLKLSGGRRFKGLTISIAALALGALTIQIAHAQSVGQVASGGRLLAPTAQHSAVTLSDDTVLVIGGEDFIDAVWIGGAVYVPSAGTSVGATTGAPADSARTTPGAVRLQNGRVLVVGGYAYTDTNAGPTASAELYDPTSRAWSSTGAMSTPRAFHTTTLLADGRVLVVGGAIGSFEAGFTTLASAELYNPATGAFSATGALAGPRDLHTATLLDDGRVLVAGCATSPFAELYNPTTGAFSATGSPIGNRCVGTATLLPNGLVLLAGGGAFNEARSLQSAELFDPVAGTFRATGNMTTPRLGHTATLLPDGRVLIAGGVNRSSVSTETYLASMEIYDPATGAFSPAPSLATARSWHTANSLSDGRVVFIGGQNRGGSTSVQTPPVALDSVEIFTPPEPTAMLTGSFGPSGGVTLAVWSGGTADQLVDAATDEGCALQSFWVNREGGGLVGFIPTPIESVNREFFNDFPGGALASMPVIVVCRRS